VRFGPVTPEFMLLTITPFRVMHITPNISESPGPILTNFTGLVGVSMGMIILTFILRSPKKSCYGNQLNLGDVCRHRQERPLLFALVFDNGSDDHEATFKRLNGNNPATSCTNLVNFHPIISEFMLLRRVIFAVIQPQFDSDLHSLPWCSKTDWKITILISEESSAFDNYFCTSCRNFVRFGSVTPEFKI